MIFEKLLWAVKRHPFLYLTRFRLLSKNSNIQDIDAFDYNTLNKKPQIPSYFHDVNGRIFKGHTPNTDLEKVKQLGLWLKSNIKGGPGLSEPSEQALHTMLSGKGGVCSDMAQIFNNFCVINELAVREWGTTTAPFNKEFGGHSFNEVFIKELNKWVLVDISYNIMFYFDTDEPLSVIELYQIKRSGYKVIYKNFGEGDTVSLKIINKNYLNEGVTPFLICNYRNAIYDKYLAITRPYVPVFMTHFMIFLVHKSYHYRFPLDNYKRIFS
ncbi:transglutaminase-like domain-containing protein [Psychroserpens sp.]|uniref:transglutaminase-like domain-containing protein n=1 Tax=Psychroserpens sp. TaxID=2020870 RepID=UPI003C7104B7